MRARDVMTRDVATARPETPVREAAALLAERGCTSLPVVDEDNRLIGIVSEIDLLRDRLPADPRTSERPSTGDRPDPKRTVGEVMTTPAVCLSPDADGAAVAAVMNENRVRAVPITEGGTLVGIVSRRDLLRTLLRDDTGIAAEVRERLGEYAGGPSPWPVEVHDGVVTVRGRFTGDQPRVIDVIARTVPGVVRVHCEPHRTLAHPLGQELTEVLPEP